MKAFDLAYGTLKRVHVNKHVIQSNRKTGAHEPVFTIQTSKGPLKASRVLITGHAFFMQAGTPDINGDIIKPLSCGAVAWVETRAAVRFWK